MYRIKEVGEMFIPQKYEFLKGWYGIPREGFYLWDSDYNQRNHCSFKTLEEARNRIKNYKLEIKLPKVKTPKFKIHKEK